MSFYSSFSRGFGHFFLQSFSELPSFELLLYLICNYYYSVLRLCACLYISIFLYCEISWRKWLGFIPVNCLRSGLKSALFSVVCPARNMWHGTYQRSIHIWAHRCSVNFYWTNKLSNHLAVIQYSFCKHKRQNSVDVFYIRVLLSWSSFTVSVFVEGSVNPLNIHVIVWISAHIIFKSVYRFHQILKRFPDT